MGKNQKHNSDVSTDKSTTKHDQIFVMREPHNGAGLEELSTQGNWQPHSTGAFLTGLKKKSHDVGSDKADGMCRNRIVPPVSQ